MKRLAVLEGQGKVVDQLLLFLRKLQRIFRIDRREIHIQHLVIFAMDLYGSLCEVDVFQMDPVVDLVIRVTFDRLSLQFELNHRDRLVHLRCKSRIYGIINVLIENFRKEALARIILINPRCKHRQLAEIDPISILEDIKAIIADRDPQNGTDAGKVAGSCAHPGDIVVAPLDIHIVEVHQLVHDDIRTRSTIKDIADNVQTVHSQVLDQVAQCLDKFISHTDIDDGVDDLIVVHLLIIIVVVHMQKLIDDIRECRRHFFTHFRSCKFRGNLFTDAHQTVDRDSLPVFCIFSLFLDPADIPFRIVDQVRQSNLLVVRNHVAEGLRYFFTDNTGGTAKQMDKCFVFAVQVTEEILGSFRKSPDRHQVDDLTGCRFHCRILFCKQLQVVQISHYRYFPPCFFPGAYKFFPAVPCPVFPLQFSRCVNCSGFFRCFAFPAFCRIFAGFFHLAG